MKLKNLIFKKMRPGRESNPRTRFCRPLPEPLGHQARLKLPSDFILTNQAFKSTSKEFFDKSSFDFKILN